MGKSIIDLFKTETFSFKDNGKTETAETHFAIRNSKEVRTEPKNPLLLPAFKLRDGIQKITSRRDRETLLEEETGGLRALMLLSGPIIYGTDIIRLKKRTTDSRDLMVSKANGGGGSKGLLTGVLNFAKNAPKKLGSLLGAKFPEQMIPSRFIDNKNFKAGSSDLPDQISKILKESEGNGFGRFLQSSITGTPQQMGNQIVTKGLGEIKNAVNQALFGSRKEGAVNLAKKPSNKRYYDAYSLYSDVVDEYNTDIKLRNDLSQRFNAFQVISKSNGIFGPPTFAKKIDNVNLNNTVVASLYQMPFAKDFDIYDWRTFVNKIGQKASPFSSSNKRGIKLVGDALKASRLANQYVPTDPDTGLPIEYTDRIDLTWGPNSTTTIDNRNDLSTFLDSYIYYGLNNPVQRTSKYDIGLNDFGVPINMGLYPKYSTTNIDPIATGNTKGYDIQRSIEYYREIDRVDPNTGTRFGDTLNKQGPNSSTSYTAVIGGVNKTLDEIDFITLKFMQENGGNRYAYFRGTISSFSETFTPGYAQHQGVGQAYPFYTLETVERSIQFNFKVYSHEPNEHIAAWERLRFLASLTMPQGYGATTGYTTPPTIKFTLGDMFINRVAFIETLNYTTDQNFPWEIGLNAAFLDCYKLPMIIDVSVTLHLIDDKDDVDDGQRLYSFWKGGTKRTTNPAVAALAVNPASLNLPTADPPLPSIKRIPTSLQPISVPRPNLSVGQITIPQNLTNRLTNITIPSPSKSGNPLNSLTDINGNSNTNNAKENEDKNLKVPESKKDADSTKEKLTKTKIKKNKKSKNTDNLETNSTKKEGVVDYLKDEDKDTSKTAAIKKGDIVTVEGTGVGIDIGFAKKVAVANAQHAAVRKIIGLSSVWYGQFNISTDIKDEKVLQNTEGSINKYIVTVTAECKINSASVGKAPQDSLSGTYPPGSPQRAEAEKKFQKQLDDYETEKKVIEAWNAEN